MKEVSVIVGIHVVILILYMGGLNLFGGMAFVLTAVMLPIHLLLCFIMAITNYFSQDSDKEIARKFALANVLAGIVVGIIGFSFCFYVFAKNTEIKRGIDIQCVK